MKDVIIGSVKQLTNISDTLIERGYRYGDYLGQSTVTQNIKKAMMDSPNWDDLSPDKKEALEMIALKSARILCGDPDYIDNWHDIIGYAKLVEDELLKS